ncbi:hypothetical protein JL720_15219 [Aureococcus anophagefferens]|nr:hypothetical protein JL720_15219 [Aureococcus anophagefferens]
MAVDAAEGGATAASMCAASASDAHVAFRFEERADGKVRVIVVSGTVFMIWPDIFELCNVREKVAIALDVSSAAAERVAPTPFHYRSPAAVVARPEDAAELSPPAGPMLRPPTASVAGQRLDVLRLRPLGPELSSGARALGAMIGSARLAPMTERIDVFCRSMSGLSVKWGHGVPPVLERNVKTHGNVYGLRGGAGSSDLDDRQQPTLQTIAATNDVLVPPGTHRNSRLALQPYSGSYPDGIMRAYEAVSDSVARRRRRRGGAVLARVATGQFDGVPVAVGASPVYATASDDEAVVFVGFYPPVAQADALKFADDVALDPRRPWRRSWRVGRCLEAKAQCRRFAVLVVTADGEHSAAVNACNEYVAAFVGGSVPQPLEALISAAPGLREFLRAERPLCLVDFVHSLRRIWGKSQDYFLLSGDEQRRRRRVRGRGPRAVLVAELKFDLSPAAAIVVKHRVDLGGGEPCQLCVNAGGTMCFVTVWDATSGRVVAVDFEDAFSAKAYGAPFDQSWTIWGITEALVTLPDGGGAAAPAHETAPRVVVGALNGSRLVACDPSGVANVLLAGGDVAGDRDGALPHAQLDQPLGLVTSPHGRASVYVASAAGHCAGSVRLFNFGTTGLRKLMANLRAIGEACVLPDDYGYIRRNLGALPFDSVDAYRAHVHRRPFREAVAAMTAAIESIVADMDVMGAAISRSGGVNATKGPDATPSSATAPRPEGGGRENAVLERCDGMDDGAAALRFSLAATARPATAGTPTGTVLATELAPGQVVVVLAPASAYYDHCFMCRRRVATLWRCAHCVKSLCREHAKAADDGPPSASWTDSDGKFMDVSAALELAALKAWGSGARDSGAPREARRGRAALHVDDDDDDDEEEEEEGEGDDGDDDDDDDDDDEVRARRRSPAARRRAVARGRAPPAAQLQH